MYGNASRVADIERFWPAQWRHAKEALRLRLWDLEDGASLALTCGIIAGRKEGPMVSIVSGQHGDEWNGVYLCHQLFNLIEPQDIQGKIVIIPVANPWAFWEKQRISSVDGVDMNRCYTFLTDRRPTEKIARLLFERIFKESDYVIDIHSGGSGEYLPNVGVTEQGRVELALSFNTGYVIIIDKDRGSLVPACERNSIPAFSVEIGKGLSIDYQSGDLFVNEGLFNFLRTIGILAGTVNTIKDQQLFTAKTVVNAPVSGFFHPAVELGQLVEADQSIGGVASLFSPKSVTARTSVGGTVIYLRREEKVAVGDSLLHLVYSKPLGER